MPLGFNTVILASSAVWPATAPKLSRQSMPARKQPVPSSFLTLQCRNLLPEKKVTSDNITRPGIFPSDNLRPILQLTEW